MLIGHQNGHHRDISAQRVKDRIQASVGDCDNGSAEKFQLWSVGTAAG
ncbi:hypothetical protein [Nitrosococcus wardiae]|nr:hypothetical protein [Nitrosococcus wardiae]